MSFLVIPGIDVAGGRLVRISPDGFLPVKAFGGDPIAAARAFTEAGAEWIHLVDLDLAFTGEAGNLDVVRAAASLPVRVQAAGGVLSGGDAEALLEAGAARVVLGSGLLAVRPRLAGLVRALGERTVVGVEVDDGHVRPRGRIPADLPLEPTLAWLAEARPARCLVTAVSRVGAGGGPDVGAVTAAARALPCPVVAAGGIATIDDLRELAAVPGVEGAVVGRALLDGLLDLRSALDAVAP